MANKVVVEIDVKTGDASKKIDKAEAGVKDLKKYHLQYQLNQTENQYFHQIEDF